MSFFLVSHDTTAARDRVSSRIGTHNSRYNCCLRKEGMFGRAVNKDVMIEVRMCRRFGVDAGGVLGENTRG